MHTTTFFQPLAPHVFDFERLHKWAMFLITLQEKDAKISRGNNYRLGNHLRIHGLDKQDFIFIIHSHYNEQLRLAAVKIGAQRVLVAHEFIWITCCRRISHLFKGEGVNTSMHKSTKSN
jgi:hypothetical protein